VYENNFFSRLSFLLLALPREVQIHMSPSRLLFKQLLRAAQKYGEVLDTRPVPLIEVCSKFVNAAELPLPPALLQHIHAKSGVAINTQLSSASASVSMDAYFSPKTVEETSGFIRCIQSRFSSAVLRRLVVAAFRSTEQTNQTLSAGFATLRFLRDEYANIQKNIASSRTVTVEYIHKVDKPTGRDTSQVKHLPLNLISVLVGNDNVQLPPSSPNSSESKDASKIKITLTARCDESSMHRSGTNLRCTLPVSSLSSPFLSTGLPQAWFWMDLKIENLGSSDLKILSHHAMLRDPYGTIVGMWREDSVMSRKYADVEQKLCVKPDNDAATGYSVDSDMASGGNTKPLLPANSNEKSQFRCTSLIASPQPLIGSICFIGQLLVCHFTDPFFYVDCSCTFNL
jgi:hypothetical protein